MRAIENLPYLTTFNANGQEHSSPHSARLDKFGHVLTKPASLWLHGFSRVCLLEFRPGWWGQKRNAAIETLYRTCLVIVGIVTLPFAILGALLGAPMRAIASLSKRDFIFHKALTTPLKTHQKTSILTYNALLMPEFITCRNKHRPTMERVHEIAEALIKANSDFICLQEAFHTEASEVLDEKLHKRGYHIVRNIGHKILGLNSGLFLASKHELSSVRFIPHPLKSGMDSWANKGLLLATAKVGDKTYIIGNTHLNGGGTSTLPSYAVRALQTLAVTAQMDKYIKESISAGVSIDGAFLCGDTNISPYYYSNKRDSQGFLTPKIEPEWLMAKKLFEVNDSLPIHDRAEFLSKVKAIFKQLEKQSSTMEPTAFVQAGGSFPPQLYKHDLQNASPIQALQGSTVDLGFNPQVGWDSAQAAQPERVDFISVRKPFMFNGKAMSSPDLHEVKLTPIVNNKGFLCSDHHAVLTKI